MSMQVERVIRLKVCAGMAEEIDKQLLVRGLAWQGKGDFLREDPVGEGEGQKKAAMRKVALVVKNPPASDAAQEMGVVSLGWEDPLEEETATHSSTLAWRIPWTEEPGGLGSLGSQRVRHDEATQHAHMHNEKQL